MYKKYSLLKIRLFYGVLVVKTKSQLFFKEREGFTPMLKIGNIYIVWSRYKAR